MLPTAVIERITVGTSLRISRPSQYQHQFIAFPQLKGVDSIVGCKWCVANRCEIIGITIEFRYRYHDHHVPEAVPSLFKVHIRWFRHRLGNRGVANGCEVVGRTAASASDILDITVLEAVPSLFHNSFPWVPSFAWK